MPKKRRIEFNEASSPITDAVTKFGGQPVWISEPQWPLSRETGNPMRFICQISIRDDLHANLAAKMAYLFMTEEEDGEFVDGTYEPEGGENAAILQPGNVECPFSPLHQGPTLFRMVEKPGKEMLEPEDCEFSVTLIDEDDLEFVLDTDQSELSEGERESVTGNLDENKIGGTPVFMQGDEFPFEGSNHLLLQLDSCSVPFSINFGDAGVGYAFLDQFGERARFLWQCG